MIRRVDVKCDNCCERFDFFDIFKGIFGIISQYRYALIISFAFIIAGVVSEKSASAAYVGDDKSIGVSFVDNVGGESNVGVRISKNNNTLYYALDTWKKTDSNNWQYVGSNIDGDIVNAGEYKGHPIFMLGTSGARFAIDIDYLLDCVPLNGSIVLKKYVYGRCVYEKEEYTYNVNESNRIDASESILKAVKAVNEGGSIDNLKGSILTLDSTSYGYDGVSYIYDIYDAAIINSGSDINVDTSECYVKTSGYAYYGAHGEYTIKSFPKIEHIETVGSTCTFNGWYTMPEGGNKIHIGDAIDIGDTIYPRWDIVPNSYEVKCIDILGDNPEGEILNTVLLEELYGKHISGADIGADESAGAYYTGLCYKGCTEADVEEGCIIYRYFRPIIYDIIFNGNGETRGEMPSIMGCEYGSTHVLTTNTYEKDVVFTLDLNAEDATCTEETIIVPYIFKGWSDTVSGSAIYSDGESVTKICEEEGIKNLYAVWECDAVQIDAVPEREGYCFYGWSLEKDAGDNGNIGGELFYPSGEKSITLYAVWEPLEAKYRVECYVKDKNGNYVLDNTYEFFSHTGYEVDCENDQYLNSIYDKYTLDKENSICKGIVKYDGSLILKYYYKEKEIEDGTGGSTEDDGNNVGNDNGDSSSGGVSGDENESSGGSGSGSGASGSNSGSSGGSGSSSGGSGSSSGASGSGGGSGSGSGASGSGGGSGSSSGGSGSSSGGSVSSGSNSSSGVGEGGDDILRLGSSDLYNEKDKSSLKNTKKEKGLNVNSEFNKLYSIYTISGINYKILKDTKKLRTAMVVKVQRSKKEVLIPDYIKINGYKYKVVKIGKKALSESKKLKKTIIGRNVKVIGEKAFYKSSNLGNIKLKSKKIKVIGKEAFKGIKRKCILKIAGKKKYAKKVFGMISKSL